MSLDNAVCERLESGGTALGARTHSMSPILIEEYGRLGYDFVWVDLEHAGASPYDATALDPLVRAAEAADVELLVRVPHADPPLVHKVLSAGVTSLLVPQIDDAAEVRRAVRAARFEYDGEPGNRGFGGGRPAAWGADAERFTERADETVLVGAMIETAAAVENLEEILAVPDLGFAFVGPTDLSISMGYPQETDHPEVTAAIDRVEEACLDAGVPLGAPRHGVDDAENALEDGYRILRVGDEIGAVRDVLGARLDALR
ncbi:HpcH/HpaI aldolase/citrate lyase family protein [Halopenitus salinus]|uniref:HpcH/HpaI aldolase/citrate lyase family protein n=1 Tax=Halopenitus salinus TaxID=1198295 RepID=A0ABD5UX75_9EURY